MSLAADVQEQIRRYVVGSVSADDLSDWLDAHAHAILAEDDRALRSLTDLTFSVLEDVFQGQRSDAEARRLIGLKVASGVS